MTVSGGAVTSATIKEPGSGYTASETLYFDSSAIGGTPSANIVTALSGISTATADYVQITGIGTATGGYYRITDASDKKQLTIAKRLEVIQQLFQVSMQWLLVELALLLPTV